MKERQISPEEVRAEHVAEVNTRAHWLYVTAVLVLSALAMIGFIAVLDVLS